MTGLNVRKLTGTNWEWQCAAGLGLLAAQLAAVPAQADVALTATLQTGTTPTAQTQQSQTQTATQTAQTTPATDPGTGLTTQSVRLFLQGSNARLEVAGEPILLYTGKTSLVNGLDPARKTYYMTVTTDTEDASLVPSGPGVTETVKLDLDPVKDAPPRTLAGQSTHPYTLTGTITFARARPAGGRGGGGRRHRGGGGFPGGGGGGFPLFTGAHFAGAPMGASAAVDQYGGGGGGDNSNGGGYGGGNNAGDRGERLPQWTLSGDLWLADSVGFPAKENTSVAASLIAASAGPFAAPLADALAKRKGLPLLARVTVLCTPPSAGGRTVNQYGGVVEGAPAPHPISTVTTWTVQSLTVGPVDSTLFQAPVDYALVAAPQTPYTPGS